MKSTIYKGYYIRRTDFGYRVKKNKNDSYDDSYKLHQKPFGTIEQAKDFINDIAGIV